MHRVGIVGLENCDKYLEAISQLDTYEYSQILSQDLFLIDKLASTFHFNKPLADCSSKYHSVWP